MKPGTRDRATRLAEKLMADDVEAVVKAVEAPSGLGSHGVAAGSDCWSGLGKYGHLTDTNFLAIRISFISYCFYW
jgi:hypothetical protein